MRDESTDVREKAYRQASALIPPGFKGQISWGEVDNRSFLRIAHGYLLGLMHRGAHGFPDVHSALSTQSSVLSTISACQQPPWTGGGDRLLERARVRLVSARDRLC